MEHSTNPRSPAWLLVPALALASIAATWADLAGVEVVPTWIYVGELTFPGSVVGPTALAVAALARTVTAAGGDDPPGRRRLLEGGLAAVTLLGAAFAVVNLNVTEPGVFVAGLLPMATGLALAVAVLADDGVALVRARAPP